MIVFDYQAISRELDEILSKIHPELKCPKCGSTNITYRVKKTNKLAKAGFFHVGAYCQSGHFIKWVKQTDDVLKNAVPPKSLF